MANLESGTNLGYIAHHVEQWRFSHRVPSQPPSFPAPNYGFKFDGPDGYVVHDLRANGKALSRRPYAIKRGMHGIIAMVEPMRSWVRFFNFRNKTDMKPIQCWLPNSLIIVGKKPSPGRFEIAYRHEKAAVPDMSNTDRVCDGIGFENVIGIYLQTCLASDSSWVPAAFVRELGPDGENIPTITKALMEALSEAGTYEVLDLGKFNIDDFKRKCQWVDESRRSNLKFVIYFILYEDPDDGEKHLYVGKSRDIYSRLQTYANGTNNKNSPDYSGYHNQLRRRCGDNNRHMGILAQFKDEDDYEDHSAITEQFMVSCLRTYRPVLETLANKVSPQDLLASYGTSTDTASGDEGGTRSEQRARAKASGVEHYMVYKEIASQAFMAAGYNCGVGTAGFGVHQGVNWNSPLPEKHFLGSYESVLWFKDELWLADEDALAPSTTYRLSTFTKSKKNIAHWALSQVKLTNGKMLYWYAGTFFYGPHDKGNTKHKKIIEAHLQSEPCDKDAHVDDVVDGITLPKLYTEYVTQIEVLEDFDRQHPASFTRLQGINAWEDSMRAKSFAISIHWLDDDNIPRQRYIQYLYPSSYWRQKQGDGGFIPGCQTAYELGIALSHWLYGDPLQRLAEKTSDPEWQRECASGMFVKVKVYDPLTWTLTFDVPKPFKNIPSEAKMPWNRQRAQMQAATYRTGSGQRQLLTIDEAGTRTEITREPQKPGERRTKRKKCDTCFMINMQDCIKQPGSRACDTCLKFGRERCTWSQGCPQARDAPWNIVDVAKGVENERHRAFRSALLDQRLFDDYLDQGSDFPMVGQVIKSKLTTQQREEWLALQEEATEREE